jgi:exonuclease III
MDSAYEVYYDRNIPANLSEVSTFTCSSVLITASYLTDPVCKAREYFVRSRMLKDLPAASPKIHDFLYYVSYLPFCSFLTQDDYAKWMEFYYLRAASGAFFAISPVTAPLGMGLRSLVGNMAPGPLHYRGSFPEKEREVNQFSHFLRNICGIKAGYDIEEGAQMPIRDDLNYSGRDRLDRLIEQIQELDPDVLCLNEVFDVNDAHYITNALKRQFAHFIFSCGTRSIGLNSGLFFASKFAVSHHLFKPFPKEMVVGSAKHCEKGVLFVDLKDTQGEIVTIALTHGQHSDQVRYGSPEEKKARAQEFQFLQQHLAGKERILVTGDLNMDDAEMQEEQNIEIYDQFTKRVRYFCEDGKEQFTWGGDSWYVDFGNRTALYPTFPTSANRLEPRRPSLGCNLDHTMVSKETMLVESVLVQDLIPYDPFKISREGFSDHRGIWSVIHFFED